MESNEQRREAGWERELLERLAFSSLQEQRSRRRWGIFFKVLGFLYLTVLLVVVTGVAGHSNAKDKHSALVELRGVIDSEGDSGAESVVAALNDAFKEVNAQGVILRINSPGGSPVQSSIIFDEIKRLRGKYPDKPLHVVVEDVCASGGYFVAAAADRIYVNRASIVGSIGVLMDGFGFTNTMEKLGVERRLMTAGENKGFLDPFSAQDARHRQHAQSLLDDIHRQFIDAVRKGRGSRLKETPEMFSGLMWTGQQSLELGLVDDFGTVESVARDIIKAEQVVDYTLHRSLTDRLAQRFGTSMGSAVGNTLRQWRLL
jgi:protease IV